MPSSPLLLRLCAILCLCGCLAVVAANLLGVLVHPEVGLVRHTISDLAAGRHAWIMDAGLVAFALGLGALAYALAQMHWAGRSWTLGTICLALVAILIGFIALHDAYGDRQQGGWVVHFPVVVAMAVLFTLAVALTAHGFADHKPGWMRFNLAMATMWIAAALAFYVSPTLIDGLVERLAGGVMVVWVAALSRLVLSEAKAAEHGARTPPPASRFA